MHDSQPGVYGKHFAKRVCLNYAQTQMVIQMSSRLFVYHWRSRPVKWNPKMKAEMPYQLNCKTDIVRRTLIHGSELLYALMQLF